MLNLTSKIIVDIPDYRYIDELKKFGPQMRVLCTVQSIVEMLNKGVDLRIPDKWSTEIYALVKIYNDAAREKKMKTADLAEARLVKHIELDVKTAQKKIDNPFEDNGPRFEPKLPPQVVPVNLEIAKKLADQGVGGLKRAKIAIKRPKAYELIKPDIKTPVQKDSFYDGIVLSGD